MYADCMVHRYRNSFRAGTVRASQAELYAALLERATSKEVSSPKKNLFRVPACFYCQPGQRAARLDHIGRFMLQQAAKDSELRPKHVALGHGSNHPAGSRFHDIQDR